MREEDIAAVRMFYNLYKLSFQVRSERESNVLCICPQTGL